MFPFAPGFLNFGGCSALRSAFAPAGDSGNALLTIVADGYGMATPKNSRQSTMQQLAPYMGLGMQLAAAMVVFGALGWWLDERFGTTPWLLVVGIVLGATGGMIHLIRTAIGSSKRKSDPAS